MIIIIDLNMNVNTPYPRQSTVKATTESGIISHLCPRSKTSKLILYVVLSIAIGAAGILSTKNELFVSHMEGMKTRLSSSSKETKNIQHVMDSSNGREQPQFSNTTDVLKTQVMTNSSEPVFRITPLGPACLSHIHSQDKVDKKYSSKFHRSCKFLPPPTEIASRCPTDELEKHIMDSYSHEEDNLQRYVMFVASAHSGHSLVGSLLDSHPMMLVANEADIFSKYLGNSEMGPQPLHTRDEMFDEIFSNSVKCALFSRYQHDYNYTIPNGWGGHWIPGKLTVIGDKKGGSTRQKLKQLAKEESNEHMVSVFRDFQEIIGLPIRIINVFWDRDAVYRGSDRFIQTLKDGIPSVSSFDWDNGVYTCGDEASRRALLRNACDFLGVPCDSSVIDMWSSMASCKAATKHVSVSGQGSDSD